MLIGRLSQMSPPPCLYDTVIQSYVQLKSGFYGVHHRKSMGQLWDAPRDAQIPFFKDRVRVPIFLSWYSPIPIPIPVFWDVAVFQVMTQ